MTTWSQVAVKLAFVPGAFSSANEAAILNDLEQMFNTSGVAASALAGATSDGVLTIDAAPAGRYAFYDPGTHSVNFNLNDIASIKYFNTTGAWVSEIPSLTFIHEIIHAGLGLKDLLGSGESFLNGANADQAGDTVRAQNVVAHDMGWSSNIQASYAATSGMVPENEALVVGKSYTDGAEIDNARLGTSGADDLDHSSNTDNIRDLMFGFVGDDTIQAGAGDDFVYGGSGNDIIEGGDGNDKLDGEAGADNISGDMGNDLLVSTSGNDTLVGGQGDDVYSVEKSEQTYSDSDKITIKFAPGDGHDYIYTSQGDRTSAQEDAFRQLELRTGVHYERSITIDLTSFNASDVHLVWDKHQDGTLSGGTPSYSGDAALVVNGTGESIYLGNLTTNGNSDVQFVDSQEHITLQFAGDVLVDIGWMESGDLHSGLTDFMAVETGSVDAYRGALAQWPDAAPPPPPPPTSAQSVTADASGLAVGTEYNDTLSGAGASATLAGGSGDDTYVWGHGAGTTQVIDTGDDAGDRLELLGINADSVTIQTLGSDALLVIAPSQAGGSDGGVITLSGALDANSPDGIDQLVFADGTTWSRADILLHAAVPVGGAGDDTLLGSSKAETLVGGAGNDSIDGGGGGDTIAWSRGDGDDWVATNVGDTLALHGVTASQAHLIAEPGQDVKILISPSTPGAQDGGSIDLPGGLDAYHETIIAFDDGTTWSQSSWQSRLELQPATAGNDTIVGFAGAHTLAGGAGDDLLQSAGGQDAIVWSHGDGKDTVTGYGTDTLVLQDATPDQVTFTHVGSDLTAHIAPSAQGGDGGSVAMVGSSELDTWGGPVTQVQFADGSILTRDEIRVRLLIADATPGADSITGFSSDDTLGGGQGDDQLSGKSGDDTYVWHPGDGHDTVSDGAYYGDDTLVLHGVTPDQITLHSIGGNLELDIAPSTPGGSDGGSVVLVGEGGDYQAGVEHVVFDGGVTWSASDLFQQVLGQEGTAGNDTIVGFVTDDTLAGGAGDDVLTGGTGSDTFLIDGAGQKTVTDFTHGEDKIDVSAVGVASFNGLMSHLTQVGADTVLSVTYNGQAAIVTLKDVSLATLDAGDFTFAPPAAPTNLTDAAIVSGYVNAAHDTAAQVLTGVADMGATVTVYDGATQLGTAVADTTTGAWSYMLGELADGPHGLTATATNAIAQVGPASAALEFTVDTKAPTAPTALADAAVSAGHVSAVANVAAQALTGTAEAGATVTVYDGATQLGTAVANNAGAWSYTLGHLTDGAHSLTATAADVAGNTGTASTALAFTVDAPVAPAIPVAPSGLADAAIVNGYVNKAGDTASQALTGMAGAGVTVTVYDGTTKLGTTTAGGDGAWSYTLGHLADGTHNLTATATDAAAHVSAASAALTFKVDTVGPSTPNGLANTSISQGYVNATHNVAGQTLTGKTDASATVTVYDGATQLATVKAGTTGAWSYVLGPLSEGGHNLTATATDAAGNTSVSSDPVAFTVDTHAPGAPTNLADAAIVGGYVNAARDLATQALTGKAEAYAFVSVYEGATKLGQVQVSGTGTWSYTLGTLADGAHSLTATAADKAGNVSPSGGPLAFTVDTHLPAASVSKAIVGAVATTLSLSGVSEAGATVSVSEGATKLGSAVADGTGAWSVTLTGLSNTLHSLGLSATDLAGNKASGGLGLYNPASNVAIVGTAASDLLIGRPGDTLTGGAGADQFAFGANAGPETITDFTPSTSSIAGDVLQVDHTLATSFADLMSDATQVGTDVSISFAIGGSLTLQNVQLSSLHTGDFLFV